VDIRFNPLTKGTTLDIFSDIGTEPRPPEVILDKFFHLKMSRVTCSRVIMELAEEVMSQGGRDIGTVLIL
jgi:hypothetical protein